MKKLLLPIMLSAFMLPTLSMAETNNQAETVKTEIMKKDFKREKNLTPEQKEKFFNERISQMELHSKRLQEDANKLKGMNLEEKEDWFKAKREEMKEKHHKKGKKHKGKALKHKCANLYKMEAPKSPEEMMEMLKKSERYIKADANQKQKMEEKINKIAEKSPEERIKNFEKRKAHLESKCEKMESSK